MCTHNNCIYCFGGMDDERSETNNMWRWDLSTDDGFEPVVYRQAPLSLAATASSSHHFCISLSDLLHHTLVSNLSLCPAVSLLLEALITGKALKVQQIICMAISLQPCSAIVEGLHRLR